MQKTARRRLRARHDPGVRASVAREHLWLVFRVPSLTQSINAGRGVRWVDSVSRAQIADGVRGPRADASESTRRAECAAPCLSLHVIDSPAGSLSAWRRRAMQPGGVSANDTRAHPATRRGPAWRRRAMQPGGVSANDTRAHPATRRVLVGQRQQDLAGADDLLLEEMPGVVDEQHESAAVSRDLMDLG